jgi:hypothetical protein
MDDVADIVVLTDRIPALYHYPKHFVLAVLGVFHFRWQIRSQDSPTQAELGHEPPQLWRCQW